MYTSFYAGSTGAMSQRSRHHRKNQPIVPPTATELREGGFDRQSVLHINQRVLNNKIVVKKIVTDSSFVIYHEDFRQEFLIKQIPETESIDKWIDLQTHSNLVTAFDSFTEPESGLKFQMTELNNGGNMYAYIESLKLDLAMEVPRTYLELIYDVGIQLATALDFAHNAGLVHGQFDLSKVQIQNNGENFEFKITDFCPTSSMDLPLSSEANYWPFAKNKKEITQREKMEVLMLKDVYSLGICLLEMMIGRFSKKKFSISLDSLPLTWAEFPESTPIIQVLVECIQIDSITQRKGKLQHIRKLLIAEYKKYFKRTFYKMENPYVGKKADVLNKKGIISLFHRKGEDNVALNYWQEAELLNDRHFDSKCNFVMFRWSTAKITDAQMIGELDEFVFDVPHKGTQYRAYLLIGQGEKEQGIQLLKEYIEETRKEIKSSRIPDQKMAKYLKNAEDILSQVQLDKDTFIQNGQTKHGHTTTVKHLAFGPSGKCIVTTSSDETRVWKVSQQLIGIQCQIPAEEPQSNEQTPLSCVNSEATRVVVHRGKLIFTIYNIEDNRATKLDAIDLQKEIKACGNPGFSLAIGDQVNDMRFMDAECTIMRVYFTKAKELYFIDVQLSDSVPKMRKAKAYEDRSVMVLQQGKNLATLQNTLQVLITDETKAGNVLSFPETDQNTVAVLMREQPDEKHILIFDIKRNTFIRKIAKKDMESEAFALDSTGRILAQADGHDLTLKLIRLPNNAALMDCFRPRYAVAEKKLNPAQASDAKQSFKDKIYRDLHTYHMFKADALKAEKQSGLTEEQNMHLMVLKYHEATKQPHKLKSNKEFQMMQKIIFRDSQKNKLTTGNDTLAKCPIEGIEGQKRIEIYDDELTYLNPTSQISLVQISSDPARHFFLIAMDGTVFKYDLITKALMFSFKTQATKAMIMFDKDDKLLVASEKMIHLWDFFDTKEEAPELITACESDLKVERIFLNKNSANVATNLYVLVTNANDYILYKGRMEKVLLGSIGSEHQTGKITCCDFDKESTVMWLGLDNGKMICINLKTGEEVGTCVNFSEEFGKPITYLERFSGILDQNFFLVVVGETEAFVYSQKINNYKPVIYGADAKDYEGQRISSAKVAFNGKFFALGIPGDNREQAKQCRALGFFSFDRESFIIKPIKWLNKYPFKTFYMDDHLTSIMMLDAASKTLDYQFILWKFNLDQLVEKDLKKLDKGKMPGYGSDQDVDSDVDVEGEKLKLAKLNTQTTCCNLF